MKKTIKEIFRFIIFIAFVCGFLLLGRHYLGEPATKASAPETTSLDQKAENLKKYLLSAQKPQRIEFTNLSKRFEEDIQNFKNIKIPQDKNSDFYLSIQFFTDEDDKTAPLVAQIRYIDIKSGNTTKEESINLD